MALMRHVERKPAVRGCPKVNLQVRTSTEATVAFYEKFGCCVEEWDSLGKRFQTSPEPRVISARLSGRTGVTRWPGTTRGWNHGLYADYDGDRGERIRHSTIRGASP
jgi:hypothetical protein